MIAERTKNGKFVSLIDFLDRIKDKNLNKKSLEALIKAGAMDEFGERGNLLFNLESILAYNKEKNTAPESQDSLFGLMTDKSTVPQLKLQPSAPANQADKLMWEKELLGLYISGHPLDKFKEKLDKREDTIKKLKEDPQEGKEVMVGGIIEELKEIATKKGDMMLFLKVADFTGSIEVVIFPKVLREFKPVFVLENCVALKGKISLRNGNVSILAEKAKVM